jgi:hypothetical protein
MPKFKFLCHTEEEKERGEAKPQEKNAEDKRLHLGGEECKKGGQKNNRLHCSRFG